MPAYSPSLRVELITSGDQAGQWGNTTNSNFQYIFDSAIAGYVPITVGNPIPANYVLTYSNGPVADENLNQSIAAMLQLNSAAAAFNVFAPPVSKQYIIWNNSGYAATIYNSSAIGNTTAAGLGVIIANGEKIQVFSDGTDFYASTPKVLNSVANGVVYANSSNQVTNGTALTFDGTNLGVGTPTATSKLDVVGTNVIVKSNASSGFGSFYALGATGGTAHYFFGINNVETARISSDAGNSLLFSTGVAATPQVLIDSSGRTGFGTITPASIVTVFKSTTAANPIGSVNNPAIRLQTDASEFNEKAEIQFQAGAVAANTGEVIAAISSLYTDFNVVGDAGGALLFSTRKSTAAGGLSERMQIDSDGNIQVGGGAATAPGGARSIDIYNTVATNNNSLSVLRLITSSVAGDGSTFNGDIYKTKGGAFVLHNYETDPAAYIGFGIGTTEWMRLSSAGVLTVNSVPVATTTALQALYPVGSIYISTASANPAAGFGFGTWVAFGAGRVLIGVGAGFAAGATGGNKDAVVVNHDHTASSTDSGHIHTIGYQGTAAGPAYASSAVGNNIGTQTDTGFANITTTVNSNGVSGVDANLQPYVVVYMWNRTA